MESFDELKRRWQAAPVPQAEDGLAARIAKGHRKHLRQVRFMTGSFSLVYVALAWVWLSFPGRTWAFYAGLAGSALLLTATLWLQWSAAHPGADATLGTRAHAEAVLGKLRRRRFMYTKGAAWYSALLLASLFLYYTDVLADADLTFKLGAYGLTFAWGLFSHAVSAPKRRRQVAEIEEQIRELEALHTELSASSSDS